MSRDIVLFLGAGFSKSAGSPVMSQFGRETKLELTALRQPQAIMRKAVPSLLNAGETFSQFQCYCKKVNEYGVRIDENNMELNYGCQDSQNKDFRNIILGFFNHDDVFA